MPRVTCHSQHPHLPTIPPSQPSFPPPCPSFPRKREGGFTFEVQHFLPEHFCGCPVRPNTCGAYYCTTGSVNRVCDTVARSVLRGSPRRRRPIAFSALPGRMGVTEERCDAQRVELVVAGEFGAVVEGDGLAPAGNGPSSSSEGLELAWRLCLGAGRRAAGGSGVHGRSARPSSASCHPGSAPPAVLLHRVYGLGRCRSSGTGPRSPARVRTCPQARIRAPPQRRARAGSWAYRGR